MDSETLESGAAWGLHGGSESLKSKKQGPKNHRNRLPRPQDGRK